MHKTDDILLEWKDVSIGYRKNNVISSMLAENLSMKVRTGEIIGLIGRNGCGKSTLLRTMVRLQSSLKGKIMIGGKDINSISRTEYAKTVGFVSTESISIHHMTVAELVSLGRFPYTNWIGVFTALDREIVDNAINLAGISHIQDKYLYELSDGERQKTMIARVLAQDTKVMVLDEPTAFLDLPNRYEMLRLLNELAHQNGKTIIYSTHDLSIALYESDRLWLMAAGKITEGAPEDLIITKGFHKLFENSDIDFNMDTAGFQLKREFTGMMAVTGEASLNYWTSRALERIGIRTGREGSVKESIVTDFQNGTPVWFLYLYDKTYSFYSVYDLISFLKNYKKLT
ncbi:MAG: ABC transporter ATP-binding protein [Bacteroidales bacterium]|nr:ABC transporter ATP-binding protein [Bacteroidales bacterium]MBN2761996.1 ABC transporter ATP-binding protein [Bacteroidales bacterium]